MKKWDRQFDEPFEAFRAFTMFRDNSDNRDFAIISVITQCKNSKINNWYSKFNWASRTMEYDKFISSVAENTKSKELKLKDYIEQLLEILGDKLNLSLSEPDKLKVEDIIKLHTALNKTLSEITSDKANHTNNSQTIFQSIFTNAKAQEYLYKLIGEIDK